MSLSNELPDNQAIAQAFQQANKALSLLKELPAIDTLLQINKLLRYHRTSLSNFDFSVLPSSPYMKEKAETEAGKLEPYFRSRPTSILRRSICYMVDNSSGQLIGFWIESSVE